MAKSKAITQKERYRTEIQADTHHFIVDEPISMGGKDLGSTPGELISAALASCSSITVKMYADRKGWDLEEAIVEVDFQKDAQSNLTHFRKSISLKGNLDEEQKQKLYEIASKCPIHRLLIHPIEISSKLK